MAEAQIQEPVIPNSPALLAPTRQAIPSYTELIARPWSVGTLLFHYSPAAPNQTEEKPQELRVVLLGSMLQQTGALTDDRWRAALLLMNTQEHPDVLARSFGELDAKNQVGRLVEYLQQLEPRLRRLSLIPVRGVPLIHGDIGLSSPIPINYMGEGMNSLLAILLFMMAPHSVILVDEIGSGIHHTFLPRMWKLLSEVAQENSCQLFCTTHSYECIQAAVEGLAKSEQAQNMFRYIRLEQDTDAERTKIFPVVLEYNDLAPAVENGFEVR
ncbi:MAG TPA: AAA family ATPase [Chthonomonas sp.]|uniref:AAA family ATPase n=1 Tax=Chthonomonas sp. TaxID=2282153 RepID=UPI002B4B5BBB|nr:AAA family ATPase [Chthonomonas sp.]HLI47810.1 AAA family ATPase [Chthonomonas sp.]